MYQGNRKSQLSSQLLAESKIDWAVYLKTLCRRFCHLSREQSGGQRLPEGLRRPLETRSHFGGASFNQSAQAKITIVGQGFRGHSSQAPGLGGCSGPAGHASWFPLVRRCSVWFALPVLPRNYAHPSFPSVGIRCVVGWFEGPCKLETWFGGSGQVQQTGKKWVAARVAMVPSVVHRNTSILHSRIVEHP